MSSCRSVSEMYRIIPVNDRQVSIFISWNILTKRCREASHMDSVPPGRCVELRKSLAILTAAVGLLLHTILLSRSASQDLRVSSSLVQQSALLQAQDGSFEQMELSKRMESLLLSGSKLTPKSDFLVRPL